MIRPHVRTGGRIRPSRPDVGLETLVIAAPGPRDGLGPDARQVMALFDGVRGGRAVAEIAAAVRLPASVVRILVSDLMDKGLLARPVDARTGQPDIDILQEVLRGLREKV
ncbi:DUF742 domain-containing protein [Streptomyces sp. NPDC007872]|uniref:DUF742 domain-containing protein n=1 Tax=Streptomyces sp. NPDC007872 TaxID=3364782 RepID=UPI0036A7DEEE